MLDATVTFKLLTVTKYFRFGFFPIDLWQGFETFGIFDITSLCIIRFLIEAGTETVEGVNQ